MLYCLELRDLLVGQLSVPHFLCLYLNLTADRIDLGLGSLCWKSLFDLPWFVL